MPKPQPISGVSLQLESDNVEELAYWSTAALTGENYVAILQRFHNTFRPDTYFEIGVSTGITLELARCASIGIDPAFKLETPPISNKPSCCLYNMTSDAFFKRYSPSAIFGQPIDMAFLDGMHWFEYLLRDFIHIEKHCRPNSIVFMHDCLPADSHVARREPNDARMRTRSATPEWWAGDVWKVPLILQKYRPTLQMISFDARPTGLIALTKLDPQSTILSDNYFDIVAEFKGQTMAESGEAYLKGLDVVGTREFATREALSGLFWL
jgi:hypothetical protein